METMSEQVAQPDSFDAVARDAEVAAGVADAEDAVAQYAAAFNSGDLFQMSFDDVLDLSDRASRSVKVAANAFGVDDPGDLSSGDLFARMLQPVVDDMLSARLESVDAENAAEAERRRAATEAAVFEGVDPAEVERAKFDAENGDPSPLLRLKERFVFG